LDDSTFGQRLVHFRKIRSLKQKELAEKAGLSATRLNYYEKDKREPNVLTITKLARALGVTGDDLLGTNTPEDTTDKQIHLKILQTNKYKESSILYKVY